jgi:N-acetylglucosamine kinase-like BadF-type ATPase
VSELFLGVDGGNSKTVALIADAGGRVVGRGRAGVGDIYGAETAMGAVLNVVAAVSIAAAAASVGLSELRHGAFRLAGVDWPEDEDYWQQSIEAQLPGLPSWSVKNDGFSLLRCADLSGVGVAVTAGTGPAVAARGLGGVEFSASWWIQQMLGGRGLGSDAFAAVMAAELGLGPPTVLTERLLTLFELPDAEALLYAFTRRENPRAHSDKWWAARSVLQACADGDLVAREIVWSQARHFAGHVRVAAAKVGLTSVPGRLPVVLGGSILASEHSALRDALSEEISRQLPDAQITSAVGSPVAGALLDAMAEGGVALDESIRREVVQARHPDDFLLTY